MVASLPFIINAKLGFSFLSVKAISINEGFCLHERVRMKVSALIIEFKDLLICSAIFSGIFSF
jgi:hypothetical protein